MKDRERERVNNTYFKSSFKMILIIIIIIKHASGHMTSSSTHCMYTYLLTDISMVEALPIADNCFKDLR